MGYQLTVEENGLVGETPESRLDDQALPICRVQDVDLTQQLAFALKVIKDEWDIIDKKSFLQLFEKITTHEVTHSPDQAMVTSLSSAIGTDPIACQYGNRRQHLVVRMIGY